MQAPVLNNDVLCLILTHASKQSISQFMQACDSFNHIGAKYLLPRVGDIVLQQANQVASFCAFMARRGKDGTASRYPFLRGLRFCNPSYFEPRSLAGIGPILATFFVDVRRFGTRFTRLEIVDTDNFLLTDPQLPTEIAALTTLTKLKVGRVGRLGCSVLRILRSRLVHAEVSLGVLPFNHDTYKATLSPEDTDQTLLLAHSSATLETLEALHVGPHFAGPRFPSVRTLRIEFAGNVVTGDLVRTYPNLRELNTVFCGPRSTATVEGTRSVNQASQLQHGSWRSLRRYEGYLYDLYILGLTCHVPSIGIDDDSILNPHVLEAILLDTTPTSLRIHIHGGFWFLEPDFVAVFSMPQAQQLTSLHISLTLLDGYLEVEDILTAISQILGSLSLRTFTLELYAGLIWPRRATEEDGTSADDEDPDDWQILHSLRTMGTDAVADRILAFRDSLKDVVFSVESLYEQGDRPTSRCGR